MTAATYGAYPTPHRLLPSRPIPLSGAIMNIWTSFAAVAMSSVCLVSLEGCAPALAQQATAPTAPARAQAMPMDMGQDSSSNPAAVAATPPPQSPATAAAQAKFDTLTKLIGKWSAPM